jgi:hypothetical protein
MKYPFVFIVVFLFSSCAAKDFILDPINRKIVAGYTKAAKFQIGSVFECDQLTIDEGMKEGLIPQCDGKTGEPSRIKLVYIGSPKYATSKGISPGDSVSKVLKLYGKPRATLIDYGVQDNSIHWEFRGLFYKNLTFIVDSTFTRSSSISLGDEYPLKKKYIKENRFKNAKQR